MSEFTPETIERFHVLAALVRRRVQQRMGEPWNDVAFRIPEPGAPDPTVEVGAGCDGSWYMAPGRVLVSVVPMATVTAAVSLEGLADRLLVGFDASLALP